MARVTVEDAVNKIGQSIWFGFGGSSPCSSNLNEEKKPLVPQSTDKPTVNSLAVKRTSFSLMPKTLAGRVYVTNYEQRDRV